jgi:hypothetical protein
MLYHHSSNCTVTSIQGRGEGERGEEGREEGGRRRRRGGEGKMGGREGRERGMGRGGGGGEERGREGREGWKEGEGRNKCMAGAATTVLVQQKLQLMPSPSRSLPLHVPSPFPSPSPSSPLFFFSSHLSPLPFSLPPPYSQSSSTMVTLLTAVWNHTYVLLELSSSCMPSSGSRTVSS